MGSWPSDGIHSETSANNLTTRPLQKNSSKRISLKVRRLMTLAHVLTFSTPSSLVIESSSRRAGTRL